MGMLSTLSGLFSPNNPKGLALFGVIIILTLVNPWLGVLALLVTYVLAQAREHYGVLEAGGIPVVEPTMFLGSEPNFHKTVMHLEDIKRFKKFGGIWGSYVGRTPHVFIADPELIRLIFVKDFVHFGDRQDIDLGTPMLNEVLDFLPGEKWKTLRTCLSPLFTTSKLKQMSDVIADSALEFMDDLNAECGTSGRLNFQCRKRLSTWLIDMFTQTTLGIRMQDSKNPDNKFAEAFRAMVGENEEYNLLLSLSFSFPWLATIAPQFNDEPTKLLEATFRQVINTRKNSGQTNSKDFLDVLCDLWDRVHTKEFKDLGITENTVLAQAANMFLGGYETSATTLSHLLLNMAENPDVQEKMYTEVMEALERRKEKNGKTNGLEIDHDLINDVPYISACIQESLRLAPPLHRPERVCTKDWTHNGMSIKKGTIVMMASWPANRNPKVHPDQPDKFKPERFMPENKGSMDPYGLTSFGFGPRNCIGMRFAYENLKLFTCNLVKNFKVEKRADTKIKYKPGSLIIIGFAPLYLDLVQRK